MSKKAQSISQIKDSYLMCRDKGHSWDFVTDEITLGTLNKPKEFKREFICYRCTTSQHEKTEVPSFDIISRYYVYPDYYLMSGERLYVSDVRKEFFERNVRHPKTVVRLKAVGRK